MFKGLKMDIELYDDCVKFTKNGKHFIIIDGDHITIPDAGIFNLRAEIHTEGYSYQLCIAPRVITHDACYIVITGNGNDFDEQTRDFLDDYNHSLPAFRVWIEANLC
jgi:hypothetical protein